MPRAIGNSGSNGSCLFRQSCSAANSRKRRSTLQLASSPCLSATTYMVKSRPSASQWRSVLRMLTSSSATAAGASGGALSSPCCASDGAAKRSVVVARRDGSGDACSDLRLLALSVSVEATR